MKIRFFNFTKFGALSKGQKNRRKLIEQSDLFDAAWYLQQNADVARSGVDPVAHYLSHGAREGRDPSPFFSTNGYKREHADVDFSHQNPLVHYLTRAERPNESEQPSLQVESAPVSRLASPPLQRALAHVHEKPASIKLSATSGVDQLLEQLHELRPDLAKEIIRQMLMNDHAYLTRHADVKKAGLDPLRHYLEHGFKTNRQIEPVLLDGLKKYKNDEEMPAKHSYLSMSDVVEKNASFKYRCLFPAMQSGSATLTPNWPLREILLHLFSCHSVTFLRPSAKNWRNIYLLTICRNLGLDITIDYDDLLFPDFHHERGAVRSRIIKDFFDSLLEQEAEVVSTLWADSFSCSTPLIAGWLETLGKPVAVVPNKLPLRYFSNKKTFDTANTDAREGKKKLKILYPSGTATHTRDFSVISGVLMRLFQEYPYDFELTFLGLTSHLNNFCRLNPTCIKMIGLVSFEEMLEIYAAHDVVLVPLEKTIFNNAKSHIKYIEAASQGTPVIATPVAEFSAKIKDGVNGFLCDKDEDWYRILKKLIADKSILYDVGGAAYHQAKKEDCIDS